MRLWDRWDNLEEINTETVESIDISAWLEILYIVVGAILMIVGLVGCVLPVIPGPPISFIGLLMLQFGDDPAFSTGTMVFWGFTAVVVTVLDYVVPAIGTRKFGGTRYGVWGSILGLLLGIFFLTPIVGPFSVVIGPFLGAYIGELIKLQDSKLAFRAALGSFIGFLAGTMLKIFICLIMAGYFVYGLFV